MKKRRENDNKSIKKKKTMFNSWLIEFARDSQILIAIH